MKKTILILLTCFLSGCSTTSQNIAKNQDIVQEGIIIGIQPETTGEIKHILGDKTQINKEQKEDNIYSIQLKNKKVIIIKQDNEDNISIGQKVQVIVHGNKADIKPLR